MASPRLISPTGGRVVTDDRHVERVDAEKRSQTEDGRTTQVDERDPRVTLSIGVDISTRNHIGRAAKPEGHANGQCR